MKYGFIRDEECALLDELIPKIKEQFGAVRFLEIGVMGGGTARGVAARCREIDCPFEAAGVDITPWHSEDPCPGYRYYQGDSMDMWRKITGSFTLLFVDGCHCINHCMCDFLNYSPFVEVGGYCLLHDTAIQDGATSQPVFPQDHSYAGQPMSTLGVREGLQKLGMLQGHRRDWEFVKEVPSSDGLMGMCLFKKIAAL